MGTVPLQLPSSLPSSMRALFLFVFVALLFVMSAGGVGGQTGDDHGGAINTASDLTLGSSIDGRIYPADDKDVFRLDLSGASGTTDVWIYTTGDLDTVGGLFDSNTNLLMSNDDSFLVDRFRSFHFRASLRPGVYFILVVSYRNEFTGDYTLHAEAVTDPGSTIDTATRLSLDSPTPGTVGSRNDEDYFRVEFTESTNLDLYARSTNDQPFDIEVLNSQREEISVNIRALYVNTPTGRFRHGFWIRDDFGPGTFYLRVLTQSAADTYPVPYTIHAFEDVRYGDFIDECEADTRLLNDPQIRDALYACQWHFHNPEEQATVLKVKTDG